MAFPSISKRALHFFLPAVVWVILSGCATPAKYTEVNDPFNSLSSSGQRSYPSAKLCLMLTENTNRAMDYITNVNGLGVTFGNEFEPKRLVLDISNTLNTRFREVVRVRSLDESKAQSCNVLLALDLKVVIGTLSFQEVSVAMTGTLADDKGTLLDTVTGRGKGSIPLYNSGPGGPFTASWNSALATLGKGLDDSQPLVAYITELSRHIEATQNVASINPATLDIAFWDSIKASNNPSDFQAYLQKFSNGNFESLARSRLVTLGEPVPIRTNPIGQPVNDKTNFGNYHALVIGNNNYRSITPLKTAATDAKEVAEVLKNDYAYEVTLLLDATRNQMLDAFDDLRRTLTDNDNLLIYYAGHGYLDADSDRGFWLPIDADANRRANWLSNSDLADVVRGTRARHVLVVADSCYAGTLTRGLSIQMTGLDDYSRLAQKRARTALTSGGLEPVEDSGGGKHSIFAKAFLAALESNTGVVDMSQIFSSMRREVLLNSQQTPQYGDIRQTGHEGGDFIFVRRKISH
jgi:hypothetical protein